MARKKEHEKEPNHERWLVSYADFITLLFAVFVTLYAMSQTDKKKIEEVMASMRDSFGFVSASSSPSSRPSVLDAGAMNVIPALPQRSQQTSKHGKSRGGEKEFKAAKVSIEAFLLKSGAQEKVSVSINQRGLVVSLKEGGFFDSGSAVLKPSSMTLLSDLMASLSTYSNSIRVEGHTDNVPMSSATYPSNWELSTARATSVVQYLMKQQDFEPERLSAAGYGEFRPVADNATDDGRKKNRRVDIVLLSDQGEKGEPIAAPMTPVIAPARGPANLPR